MDRNIDMRPVDHESKIEEHTARIEAGMVSLLKTVLLPPARKRLQRTKYRLPHVPGCAMFWDDLRMVSCAGCGKELLGTVDEPIRAEAKRKDLQILGHLPGRIAGHRNNRPYCEACIKEVKCSS